MKVFYSLESFFQTETHSQAFKIPGLASEKTFHSAKRLSEFWFCFFFSLSAQGRGFIAAVLGRISVFSIADKKFFLKQIKLLSLGVTCLDPCCPKLGL